MAPRSPPRPPLSAGLAKGSFQALLLLAEEVLLLSAQRKPLPQALQQLGHPRAGLRAPRALRVPGQGEVQGVQEGHLVLSEWL